MRDDGYDISDYYSIHPDYGTLEDFKRAGGRTRTSGTSACSPSWSSTTLPTSTLGSKRRGATPTVPSANYYVWSDTDERYKEARIIFLDTERSNWTWDPVAKQYYWHRFFSHQPDLNYDNPEVQEAMLNIIRFWLDMGVDGFRCDAVPYLIEREGTHCENLPETHAFLKRLRAAIDAEFEGRVLLAEANQWPADVRVYFGEGDEFHMGFHFPVMPRLFMAIRREERTPIVEIMEQTPEIPDELPVVALPAQPRRADAGDGDGRGTRLHVPGVREGSADAAQSRASAGRLAPLMDNGRRRLELMHSLLFSLPGTPVLYYGDEINMGDNIYLGDRNGVRTPMQWTLKRPQRRLLPRGSPAAVRAHRVGPGLRLPGRQRGSPGAETPSSFLHWMKEIIARSPAVLRFFWDGKLRFLIPQTKRCWLFVREDGGEPILIVCNLARRAQPVEIDLSEWLGRACPSSCSARRCSRHHRKALPTQAGALHVSVVPSGCPCHLRMYGMTVSIFDLSGLPHYLSAPAVVWRQGDAHQEHQPGRAVGS